VLSGYKFTSAKGKAGINSSLLKCGSQIKKMDPVISEYVKRKNHHDARREDLIKSVKYLRKILGSVFCIFDVHSRAVSGGQFCEGKKTERKKLIASCPRVVMIVWRRWQISCKAYDDTSRSTGLAEVELHLQLSLDRLSS